MLVLCANIKTVRMHVCETVCLMLFSLDIDECESSPCPDRADCTNTVGGFFCQCVTGFFNSSGLCYGRYTVCVSMASVCLRARAYVCVCVRKRAREHVYHLDTTPDWTVIFV